MNVVGDGTKGVWEALGVRSPVANGVVPVLASPVVGGFGVPSGIQPESLRREAKEVGSLNKGNGVLRRHTGVFVARLGISPVEAAEHGIIDRLPIHFSRVMSQHETAETIMADHSILPLPKEKRGTCQANLFARKQSCLEMLQACGQVKPAIIESRDATVPSPSPAYRHDDAFSFRSLDVEEGESTIRRTAASRHHNERILRLQDLLMRGKVGPTGITSVGIVKGRRTIIRGRKEGGINRLDLTDKGRRLLRLVFESQHPFHDAKVQPSRHLALHFQARFFVSIGHQVASLILLGWQPRNGVLPCSDELRRRSSAIQKREWRRLSLRKLRGNPTLHIHTFPV